MPPPPSSDHNKNSGSKRKLDDSDATSDPSSENASDAADKSRTGKKVKQDSQDDDESSFIPSEYISEHTATENLDRDSEQSVSFGLEDALTRSMPDSPLHDTPASSLNDLLPSPASPHRSHSAPPTSPNMTNVTPRVHPFPSDPEPLHTYACPICFASPKNATLTPCGHIMCGECLFTAVGSAVARMGMPSLAARCPVCRASIPKWDGRGGGVIGLQPRVVISL